MGTFMICLQTTSHISKSNSSFVIAKKREAKCRYRVAAMFFHFRKRKDLKNCIFSEDLLPTKFQDPVLVLHPPHTFAHPLCSCYCR